VARLIRRFLFGVSGFDPLTHCVVCLVLLAAALAATWLPAPACRTRGPGAGVALRVNPGLGGLVLDSRHMKRLPLILSCLALLISLFALHMADRTRRDIQAFIHSLPPQMTHP
jgi:hypothetical protein